MIRSCASENRIAGSEKEARSGGAEEEWRGREDAPPHLDDGGLGGRRERGSGEDERGGSHDCRGLRGAARRSVNWTEGKIDRWPDEQRKRSGASEGRGGRSKRQGVASVQRLCSRRESLCAGQLQREETYLGGGKRVATGGGVMVESEGKRERQRMWKNRSDSITSLFGRLFNLLVKDLDHISLGLVSCPSLRATKVDEGRALASRK